MISFMRSHWPLLGFGFMFNFGSSFGQSFFISEFNPQLKEAFDLSDGGLGMLYGLATLCSSLMLPFTGRLIDDWPLARYSLAVLAGLLLGVLMMAASFHWLMLIPTIFLLRQCGQGLSTHVYATSIARYFENHRGRALGLAGTGLSLAEFTYPWLVILALGLVGWRGTWLICAVAIVVLMLITQALLRSASRVAEAERAKADGSPGWQPSDTRPSMTRNQAMRTLFFWGMFFIGAAPSFIVTGMFFFRKNLIDAQGWSEISIASGVSTYAILGFVSMFLAGFLVDRFSAAKTLWLPYPLSTLALLIVGFWDHQLAFPLAMGIIGLTHGLVATTQSAVWAEAFGTQYLGAIKSMGAFITIFASAASPFIWGLMLNQGFALTDLFAYSALWTLACVAVGFAMQGWLPDRRALAS